MSLHANFSKRLFAFIIDLTIIIFLCILFYVFPFKQIINNSVCDNYKTEVKEPYDKIQIKYSGEDKIFGESTTGTLEVLSSLYSDGSISLDSYEDYIYEVTKCNNNCLSYAANLYDDLFVPYDSEKDDEDQIYQKCYALYYYFFYECSFKLNYYEDDTTTEGLESSEAKETREKELENSFKENYVNELSLLLKALNHYERLNDINIEQTDSYTTILNDIKKYGTLNEDVVTADFTVEDKNSLVSSINSYKAYTDEILSTSTLTLVDGSENTYVFDENRYELFYFSMKINETIESLNYIIPVMEQLQWAIIYSLSMFILLFSIYTMVLRGNTLGRRAAKIKLTDGHENEKLNPLYALLHDVLFRIIYILVLMYFSILIALVVMVIFFIVDFIMIKFTKKHRTIRDILSSTIVIQ